MPSEHAGLLFVDGSNRGPVLDHVAPPDQPFNLQVPDDRIGGAATPAPVPKGGVSFHHGTVLHGSAHNRSADWRRAEVLAKHARRLFPGLDESKGERWMGHRPSTPDSLPVIGRSPHHANVFMAFGHGHLGLTQAATTARLVADLVARRTPFADPRPYRPDRF